MIKKTFMQGIPYAAAWRHLRTWQSHLLGPPEMVDYLVNKYCYGEGLEIGPGKSPYGPKRRTKTLDKHTQNKDGTPDPDLIGDATAIPSDDSAFDFVISSHCLEHVPNTLRTLKEWIRVLRPNGRLLLVLPHADRTLDRHRAKTTLLHHIEDIQRLGDATFDPSHFDEMKTGWSANSDFDELKVAYERGWCAPVWDFDFRVNNDVLHYHVWTQSEMVDILRHLDLQVLYVCDCVPERTDSFVIIAQK